MKKETFVYSYMFNIPYLLEKLNNKSGYYHVDVYVPDPIYISGDFYTYSWMIVQQGNRVN